MNTFIMAGAVYPDLIFESISTTGVTNLSWQTYAYVGGGTLSDTYLSLLVEFWDIATVDASNLQVRVNSSAAPTIDYNKNVNVYNGADVYVAYISGYPYGGGIITMPENSTLSVYAKTSSGSLTFNSCDVSASVYDIS